MILGVDLRCRAGSPMSPEPPLSVDATTCLILNIVHFITCVLRSFNRCNIFSLMINCAIYHGGLWCCIVLKFWAVPARPVAVKLVPMPKNIARHGPDMRVGCPVLAHVPGPRPKHDTCCCYSSVSA
jgi:hypothetical protein